MNNSLLLASAKLIQSVIERNGGEIVFLSEINEESHIKHDIDIVVDNQGWHFIPNVIKSLYKNYSLQLVQAIQYDVGRSIYFVFFRGTESGPEFVKIDFLNDINGSGIYGVKTGNLLSNTTVKDGLKRPSYEHELSYLLVKRIVKGLIEEDQFARICQLDSLVGNKDLTNPCNSGILMSDWLRLLNYMNNRDLKLFREEIVKIHRSWKMLRYIHNTKYGAIRLFKKVSRLKNRIIYPVGLDVYLPGNTNTFPSELVPYMATPFRNRIKVFQNKDRIWIPLRYIYMVKGFLILNYRDSTLRRIIPDDSILFVHKDAIEEIILKLTERTSRRIQVLWYE